MKFYLEIPGGQYKIIGEYLIDNTLALFSVSGPEKNLSISLSDPNGVSVYKKEKDNIFKIAYTAKETGNHELRIVNNSNGPTKVEFEFLTGVAAKDYSSIAKQSNLKPMELNVSFLSKKR